MKGWFPRVEGEIVIERPVEAVFDFVADERNEPKYNARMTGARMVSPEPIGVGSRFQAVMTGPGGPAELMIEFTSFERPHCLSSRTHLSNMEIEGRLIFEPIPEGTRMRWVWDLQPRGFLRVLGPVVRRVGDRQERETWTALKRVLEAGPVPVAAGGASASSSSSKKDDRNGHVG